MPKFKAARNLTIGAHDGKPQKSVKAGESFDCSQDYHDAHLAPHSHTEESSKKAAQKAEEKDDKKPAKGGKDKE